VDGLPGEGDDFRPRYYTMRRARAILGDRLLYVHSSVGAFGTCRVYCPFIWSDEPGYHHIVPKTEHIEMALRNHARLWRQGHIWSKFPEELARFDREYYGGLNRLRQSL